METFPTRPPQLIPRYFSPVLRETGSVKPDCPGGAVQSQAYVLSQAWTLGSLQCAGCDVPSLSFSQPSTFETGEKSKGRKLTLALRSPVKAFTSLLWLGRVKQEP